jgi:hypothetical protein
VQLRVQGYMLLVNVTHEALCCRSATTAAGSCCRCSSSKDVQAQRLHHPPVQSPSKLRMQLWCHGSCCCCHQSCQLNVQCSMHLVNVTQGGLALHMHASKHLM